MPIGARACAIARHRAFEAGQSLLSARSGDVNFIAGVVLFIAPL
jgi:hypothetical protein